MLSLVPDGISHWVALVLFSVFSFTNAFQWVTFASIESSARSLFHLTTFELNLLSMIFMIVFILGAVLTCTVFERWGVRVGILVGTALNALGSILKMYPSVTHPCFAWLMVAQTWNALAQLFVLSTPPILAAQYFEADSRVFANAIASTANLLGSAAGLLVPPFIVRQAVQSQFFTLFGVQAALSCSVFLCSIFLLKPPPPPHPNATTSAPASGAGPTKKKKKKKEEEEGQASSPTTLPPPSSLREGAEDYTERLPVAEEEDDDEEAAPLPLRTVMWDVLKTGFRLLRNRDFVLLLGAFSVTTGSVWSLASLLAQMYAPYGVSEQLAGISGAGNVLLGTVVAYVVGRWVDQSHLYRIPIIICLFGSVIVLLLILLVFALVPPFTDAVRGCCVSFVIFAGVFQITAVPLCFEFAMELSFPAEESVPGVMMMVLSNLVSLVIIIVASVIIGDDEATTPSVIYVMVLILCLSVMSLLCSWFTRERLYRREEMMLRRREEQEEEAQEEHEGLQQGKALPQSVLDDGLGTE